MKGLRGFPGARNNHKAVDYSRQLLRAENILSKDEGGRWILEPEDLPYLVLVSRTVRESRASFMVVDFGLVASCLFLYPLLLFPFPLHFRRDDDSRLAVLFELAGRRKSSRTRRSNSTSDDRALISLEIRR